MDETFGRHHPYHRHRELSGFPIWVAGLIGFLLTLVAIIAIAAANNRHVRATLQQRAPATSPQITPQPTDPNAR